MWKTLAWVAVGAVVGVVATMLTRPAADFDYGDGAMTEIAASGVRAETGDAPELALMTARLAALEARLAELEGEIDELGPGPVAANPGYSPGIRANAPADLDAFQRWQVTSTVRNLSSVSSPGNDTTVERLIAGGFAPGRAAWIRQRTDELAMAEMQAQYEAQRSGKPLPADSTGFGPELALRAELGDEEYAKYRIALGQSTKVDVNRVIENSPAARAGIRQGDRIVAYGGRRIFDMREITPLTLDGAPGESVVVDIERDGIPMQLVVPRGPLGINMGTSGVNYIQLVPR